MFLEYYPSLEELYSLLKNASATNFNTIKIISNYNS